MYNYTTDPVLTKDHKVLVVNIRFNDECRNGHYDWAITADTYGRDKIKGESTIRFNDKTYWMNGGGCIHDLILEHFPEFQIFVDLHLCCVNGAPMYPSANGMYHRRNFETFKRYMRLKDDPTIDELMKARNKVDFLNSIITSGLLYQWRNESKRGMEKLGELINVDAKEIYTTAIEYNYGDRPLLDGKSSGYLGHFYTDFSVLSNLISETFSEDEYADMLQLM